MTDADTDAVPEEPPVTSKAVTLQSGVSVKEFKRLFCGKHALFSTGQQQCAYEFLCFLREDLEKRMGAASASDPAMSALKFTTETKIQCTECGQVKYHQDQASDLSLPMTEAGDTSLTQCMTDWQNSNVR
jgi:ubiquitin carboxyl-terminal hydrolase 5/13